MTRLLTALLAATFIAPVAMAQEIQYPELEAFARKALTLCPGESTVSIAPVGQAGPANFKSYRVILESKSEDKCRDVTFAMVSEKTNRVLLAAVMVLPEDARSPQAKIQERAEKSLKRKYSVSVSATPTPEGLKKVTLTNDTSQGPLHTTGYLDASQRFFMVGRLMDMKKDPRNQYLEMLGAAKGAKRGSTMSRVQVLEISDMQCPSCQVAHKEFETFLAKHGDKIGYTRVDLPFYENHDWAFRAALTARAIQKLRPDVYWDYVDFIFANQVNLNANAIKPMIDGFLQDHDVDAAAIASFTGNSKERRALVDQVGRMYDAEIFATPTILINGQKVYWNRDSDFVFKHIESLLGSASKAASK